MIENLIERVETSEDTRKKVIRALGFDEPCVPEKLSRNSFGSDEEFFHACVQLELMNHSPEYREIYRRIRREYYAQKSSQAEAERQRQHDAEIEKAIKACVLSTREQDEVDDRARQLAQSDLAAGRISYQHIGDAVERYAHELTEGAKRNKIHKADFNKQLREKLEIVRGKRH